MRQFRHTVFRFFCFGGMFASVGLLGSAAQALEPADIVVLFNTKSPLSLQVARYYMNARKLPPNHLLPVTCDVGENISEEDYRRQVVPQLVQALGERKLLPDEKAGIAGIKCIVTTFDMPLRVMAHQPSGAEKDEIAGYEKRLAVLAVTLETQAAVFDAMAAATASAPAGPPAAIATTAPAAPSWQQAAVKVNAAAMAAAQRIEKLPEAQRVKAVPAYLTLQEQITGLSGVLGSVSIPDNAPNGDAGRQHLAALGAQLRERQAQYQALAKQIDIPRIRQEIVDVRKSMEGLLGEARALDELITYLRPDQTSSSFDNELALAFNDQGYSRRGWVVNPKNLETWASMQRVPAAQVPRTVLVARLDGSTAAKAQELVDTAMKVEAKGLEGKIYLDARGLYGTDGYAIFDADIRRAAAWLKEHATIDVVLDDKQELFKAADCPDAALYCGWYSLRNYQESCQWVKGAVGYHVASYEMMSIHDPNETGWVVNLLNRGFAGTLGATDEPFLNAFPKPSLFFPLLLSGEFTQGEVWEMTSPMVSWRIGFVGDPLYNPYKVKPRVKVEDLKSHAVLRNAYEVLGR